ncbi:MAG: type II secretion system protein, partial [Verrucomicrobia bacterium]|nr:type II secretion system protein [Verrucomicrobiota bacterium]
MIPKNEMPVRRAGGFTLIELLVVIAIIGVLAAFTVVSLKGISKAKKISSAKADLEQVKAALEDYYAKYHVYPPGNQNAASVYSATQDRRAQFNQLYYELSGVKINGANFVTLDGSASIPVASVTLAYGVGWFVNCTKGSGEDAAPAHNCLAKINAQQV